MNSLTFYVFAFFILVSASESKPRDRCSDYSKLIELSTLFYEAQRSGDLPEETMRVKWRKDSTLNDRGNNGEDLTGGYFDAGDFVKFGFPMASAITVLAWGGIAYPEGYAKAGQTNYLLDAVKWGTDYFIKAHVSENEFYGQVGDGYADHANWGRPEDLNMARPAYSITTSKPGSDLAGETAAALAAASILFKDADSAYSEKLLTHAKQLFNFADKYRAVYSDSIPQAADFYRSWSGYNDELVWSATWLYKATGEESYLTYAKAGYSQYGFTNNKDVLSWDSKVGAIKVLLAQLTGDSTYINDVIKMCDYVINEVRKSPNGLTFFDQWGSLRHTSNAGLVCLQASDLDLPSDKKEAYFNHAKGQMDYILEKNGRSYVVGFGNNPPQRPHHRASSCPDAPATCDWNTFNSPEPNFHVLYGALVGGPDAPDDQYNDDRTNYVENEVAMDYNAGFQGLLAGLSVKQCS